MQSTDTEHQRAFTGAAFQRFTRLTARATGHPLTVCLAATLIAVWLITGPMFGFSDTWQLVINTGTSVVTFLMVFLIQNSQNRDSEAMQLKLDELIRANEFAHKALLDIEELSQEELDRIKTDYEQLASRARKTLRSGKFTFNAPDRKMVSFSKS